MHIKDIAYSTSMNFQLDSVEERKIISSLRVGDKKHLFEVLNNVFKQIEHCTILRINCFHIFCIELFTFGTRILYEFDINIEELFEKDYIYFEEIRKYETFYELKNWMLSVFDKIIKHILKKRILREKKLLNIQDSKLINIIMKIFH